MWKSRHRARAGRQYHLLALCMIVALLVTACGKPPIPTRPPDTGNGGSASPATDSGEPSFDLSGEKIRITGPQADPLGMPIFRIIDRLEAWGADVEDVTTTSTAGVQALAAGKSDFGAHGADEIILGAAEGVDVVGIGSHRARMPYVLVTKKEIASVADLRGKSIGMSGPNGFDAMLTRLLLSDNGMSPEQDAKFVQIGGSGDRAAALLTGRIDAATIFISHWLEIKAKSDGFTDLVYMSEQLPNFTNGAVFTSRSYLQEHKEVGVAIACANLEAFEWFHEDKQAWIDYTMEHVEGTNPEILSETYDTLNRIGMYPEDPNDVLTVQGLQLLADAMVENGDITEQVDAAQLIDRSYLEEAIEMGCGQ